MGCLIRFGLAHYFASFCCLCRLFCLDLISVAVCGCGFGFWVFVVLMEGGFGWIAGFCLVYLVVGALLAASGFWLVYYVWAWGCCGFPFAGFVAGCWW